MPGDSCLTLTAASAALDRLAILVNSEPNMLAYNRLAADNVDDRLC